MKERLLVAFGVSMAALVAAILMHVLLERLIAAPLPRLPLYAAIAVAVWAGGYRTAIPVLLLGLLPMPLLFRETLSPPIVVYTAYLGTGAIIILLGVALRSARSESALRDVEWDAFFQNASVGLHWVGPDGRILWANDAELDMLGYRRDEYVGHPISDFHADVHVADDILARLRRGDTLQQYPAQLVAKDGTARHVIINSSARFEKGRFVHTRCITLDVTERRAAQRAQALLAAIVDSSDDAIVSKSLDGTISSWNAGAERLFGYTAAEAIGQPITLIIPPDLHGEEQQILERLRRNEHIDHFETKRVTKSGRRIDISLTISPIRDGNGHVIGASKVARDITARKRAEQALREETAVTDALNQLGPTLVAELDPERVVRLVTEAATVLSAAEAGAFRTANGDVPALACTIRAPTADALANFPLCCGDEVVAKTLREHQIVRHDDLGDGTLVRSYLAVPVVSRHGSVLGGLFFGHTQPGHFTERHQRIAAGIAAHAAIAIDNARLYTQAQESDERFRQLAEQVNDVFWIVDVHESRMLYISPAYERIWGRTCDSLYQDARSFVDAVYSEDRDRVLDSMARQRRGETTAEEYRIVRPDGSIRWIWDRGYAVRNESGEIIRVAGIAEDITERRQVHSQLRASEERYRRLTELLPVAVYTCEAPTGRITYYNEKAVELWGRAPVLGDTDERFCGALRLYKADGNRLLHNHSPMSAALHDGHSARNEEVCIERPDGSRITVLVNIDPIRDAGGQISGAINVFHDVTAIKAAEQKLKDADRRKDEFLATLAHELRNPLAPLRHSLEILKRSDGSDSVVEQARETMERQLKQMVRLIDDLMDVSRITRNKLALRQERVDLLTIVHDAIAICQPQIDEAGHRLTVTLPPKPVPMNADAVRLVQVVSNLLSNACKYTPPGGDIELTATRDGNQAVLSIKDNGEGIAPGELNRIFEMFSQVGSSTAHARTHGGLGIGLTLAKQLVDLHGGTVRAESAGLGLGSEFIVQLPLAEPQQAPQRAPVAPFDAKDSVVLPLQRAGRVLVVDDNEDAAQTLAMLLRLSGFETRTVHDGASALDAAQQFRPEVMLLDIGLPNMDGYEVCRRIRDQAWGTGIVVVALTGWGQDEDRRKSSEAGFDAHLVKPVDHDALLRLLQSLRAAKPGLPPN